ncbi:putative protein tyrosine phosphatase [Cavenderia fasciculata]|uniref:Protein tyrosine phosphatase n=1 Tax=Cavenderia fasciculata TaxID=261658 RepID=F4PH39_CACFS|nr:putative protein tyrosine phosphatase [Cavenderia fasciculata]EGG25023.1 putative protein tyrosine phosphatase [Cavenderia fasciculata]|eukprot:XP_004362874.1 putative protein tyrosine phosphatase [Cavenderia fasciculata]
MSNTTCQPPQFEEMQLSGTSIISLFPDNISSVGASLALSFVINRLVHHLSINSEVKLECVSNFRSLGGLPIAGSDGKLVIRPGTIHRTAAPTNATQSDEFWLLEVMQMKTMIDLRTTWENKTISPVRKFEDNFVQYSVKKEVRETVANVLYTDDNNNNNNNNNLTGSRGRSSSSGNYNNNNNTNKLSPTDSSSSTLSTSYNGHGSLHLSPSPSHPITCNTNNNNNNTPTTWARGVSPPPLSRSVDGHLSSPTRSRPVGAENPNISPPKIHVTQATPIPVPAVNGPAPSSQAPASSSPSQRRIPSPPSMRAEREKEMEEQRNGLIWRLYNRNLSNDDIANLRKHSTGVLRKRFCIPLINNRFFLEGVYQTAPSDTKVKCTVSRYLLFNDKIGAFLLMNHLNQLGISEMYRLTLLYTQEEILTIMRILKRRENYPIMYYCSLGKDRTGMVTALLLSCLGVPRDVIIEDYAKSEVNLTPFFEQIRRYFSRVGLVKEEFAKAPREVLAGLLNWVDETFGGVPEYLEMIGFSRQEQDELKSNLIVPIEEYHQILDQTRATLLPGLQQRHDDYLLLKRSSPKFSFASPNSKFWRRVSVTKELDLHTYNK